MCNQGIAEIIFEEIAKEYSKLDEINTSENPRTTTNFNYNKDTHTKTHIIKLLKDENNERNLHHEREDLTHTSNPQ